jgi:flagellar biosynthesis protein FlhB
MIGFAISFHILRGSIYPFLFGDPFSSFMTTLSMMIGELNFADLISDVSYQGTTQIIVVIFVILVSIIIMNMIVGLGINNITNIFQTSGILRLQMTFKLIKIIEDFMNALEKCMPCLIHGVKILPKIRKPSMIYNPKWDILLQSGIRTILLTLGEPCVHLDDPVNT